MSKQGLQQIDRGSRTHHETKTRHQRKFLLVQNSGLNPGIQSRDPGLAFFNHEIPGLEKNSGIAIPKSVAQTSAHDRTSCS